MAYTMSIRLRVSETLTRGRCNHVGDDHAESGGIDRITEDRPEDTDQLLSGNVSMIA